MNWNAVMCTYITWKRILNTINAKWMITMYQNILGVSGKKISKNIREISLNIQNDNHVISQIDRGLFNIMNNFVSTTISKFI